MRYRLFDETYFPKATDGIFMEGPVPRKGETMTLKVGTKEVVERTVRDVHHEATFTGENANHGVSLAVVVLGD